MAAESGEHVEGTGGHVVLTGPPLCLALHKRVEMVRSFLCLQTGHRSGRAAADPRAPG